MMPPPTNEQLIACVMRGDPAALAPVVERYHGPLLSPSHYHPINEGATRDRRDPFCRDPGGTAQPVISWDWPG